MFSTWCVWRSNRAGKDWNWTPSGPTLRRWTFPPTIEKAIARSGRRVRRSNCARFLPNCDLSSPVPVQREAMICYVRECIKLAHDLGSPICKIFAAWRGITLYDGLATYDDTYGYNQYGYWKGDRRGFVVESMRELCQVAEDYGIVLAMQNHGPDIVNRYQDVLSLIEEVRSPAFKACMDINIEPEADSPTAAREMVGGQRGTASPFAHERGIRETPGWQCRVGGWRLFRQAFLGKAGGLSGVRRCAGLVRIPGLHGLGVLPSRAGKRKARGDRLRPQPD